MTKKASWCLFASSAGLRNLVHASQRNLTIIRETTWSQEGCHGSPDVGDEIFAVEGFCTYVHLSQYVQFSCAAGLIQWAYFSDKYCTRPLNIFDDTVSGQNVESTSCHAVSDRNETRYMARTCGEEVLGVVVDVFSDPRCGRKVGEIAVPTGLCQYQPSRRRHAGTHPRVQQCESSSLALAEYGVVRTLKQACRVFDGTSKTLLNATGHCTAKRHWAASRWPLRDPSRAQAGMIVRYERLDSCTSTGWDGVLQKLAAISRSGRLYRRPTQSLITIAIASVLFA
eukprot:TRINITY_DN33403_c0_g1_i1.p1 TRINITY_DN33403_c0_g1~~TRINITY_DN33403_c0_g1_i1.p1  ORF type:complete len:283 (-),score=30.46 TRINITY_DN33403_c0_g1_i1:163-1011(-)